MKKRIYGLCVFVIILASLITGCGKSKSTVETVYNNDEFPSFLVENVQVSRGDKDFVVFVELKDNPGFLTMAMNIEYDSNAMALIDIKNGADYQEYYFVGPKNKASGCCASWFIPELPDKIVDGKLLELHFRLMDNAERGDHPIKISRPHNGGIVDAYKEILVVNNAIGYVTIK